MTLEELVDTPWEKFKAMSDEELTAHFKQFFPVTRPEMVQRVPKNTTPEPLKQVMLDPRKAAALKAMAEEGIDISFVRRKIRR